MASKTSGKSIHGVLLVSVVDTVVFTNPSGTVRIFNRGGDPIFVRLDGVDPTVGGDDSLVVPPIQDRWFGPADTTRVEVRLISASASAYSVELV